MARVDYERAACAALGLGYEGDVSGSGFLNLGNFKPLEAEPAALAVCKLRIAIKEAILAEYGGTDQATVSAVKGVKKHLHFLPFDAYLNTQKNLKSIQSTITKHDALLDKQINMLKNSTERRYVLIAKTEEVQKQVDALPTISQQELWFASKNYDKERHTPDFKGYLNYINDLDSPFFHTILKGTQKMLLSEEDRRLHTYITGGSGSGKSELIKSLVYEYAKHPTEEAGAAVVLIEPHGDMSQEISRWVCFSENERLVYIDPNLFDDLTPVFNPLELPHGVSADIYVQQLLGVFEQLLEGDGGDSLTVNMRAVLVPALKVLLGMKDANLFDLLRFMQKNERAAPYIEKGKKSPDPFVSEFFTYDFQDAKFDRTKDALATKISSILNTEAERRLFLGQTSFDLEKLINQKKVVVFRFSKGLIGTGAARSFGRFIVATLESIGLRRAEMEKAERVPVHLFLDECQNYITESIETILQETRKYGLFLTLAQQICGFGMSPALKRVVLGTTHIKATGGNQDMQTLSSMADIAGVDVDTMRDLRVGQFFLKIGGKAGFMLNAPSFLVVKNGSSFIDMSADDWQEVKKAQAVYYRPIVPAAPAGGERAAADEAAEPLPPLV